MRYESKYLSHYAKGSEKDKHLWISRVLNPNGTYSYTYPSSTVGQNQINSPVSNNVAKKNNALKKEVENDVSRAKSSNGYSGGFNRRLMFATHTEGLFDPTRRRNAATRKEEKERRKNTERVEQERRDSLNIFQKLNEDINNINRYFKIRKQYRDTHKKTEEALAKSKGMTVNEYKIDKIKQKGKSIVDDILGRNIKKNPWKKEKDLIKAKDPDALERRKRRKAYTNRQHRSYDMNTHPQ